MISNLQVEERVNRSHESCGAGASSARIVCGCFIRVAKRIRQCLVGLSFRPQTLLRRRAFATALRRNVLGDINHRFLEAWRRQRLL